jgi:hypothetical protein
MVPIYTIGIRYRKSVFGAYMGMGHGRGVLSGEHGRITGVSNSGNKPPTMYFLQFL